MQLPIDAAAEALIRLYREAEARLLALVVETLARGAEGSAAYWRQRLTVVQRTLAELQGTAVPEATTLVTNGYMLGARMAGMEGSFDQGLHTTAVEALADALVADLNTVTETLGRRVQDEFRQAQIRHAALSLAMGSARRDASRAMADTLREQGVASFTDRAGRDWGLGTYTGMAVRTTTRAAVSHGTHNRLVEQGQDLVTITKHRGVDEGDRRCLRIAGKTFSITGATPGYDRLPLHEWPPMGTHPNCAHVAVPARQNLDALERELGLVAA